MLLVTVALLAAGCGGQSATHGAGSSATQPHGAESSATHRHRATPHRATKHRASTAHRATTHSATQRHRATQRHGATQALRAIANAGFPGPARAHPATVTHISDGDTITLTGIGKTRLIGIDTPEVYGRTECYGRAASAFTERVVPPGTHVEYRLGTEQQDRYGRALAYVWLKDGRMFNGLLAERGYATVLTVPPNVEYVRFFIAAARRARKASRGLWSPKTCNGSNPPSHPGDRDCSDFKTHAEAQSYFDSHGGSATNNFDNLDGEDHDGRVCETLP